MPISWTGNIMCGLKALQTSQVLTLAMPIHQSDMLVRHPWVISIKAVG